MRALSFTVLVWCVSDFVLAHEVPTHQLITRSALDYLFKCEDPDFASVSDLILRGKRMSDLLALAEEPIQMPEEGPQTRPSK